MAQPKTEPPGQEESKMKRILIYILFLGAVMAAPVKPLEVAKLRPVQVVSIYKEGANVVIETDTQDKGIGATATLALQNMEDTSDGIIYLDTAEYLLFTSDAEDAVEELRQRFRRSVQLCVEDRAVSLENAAKFLGSHGTLPKLKNWKNGDPLPVLSGSKESYIFLKKVENSA